MAKFMASVKAIITRLVFACHGIVAIWEVTILLKNKNYWYLALPTLLLLLEGVFTLTIKENQEWKWFCPSVFIYLGNVVPAIWLLEFYKVDSRLQAREFTNISNTVDLKEINKMLGVKIHLPNLSFSAETWITLIEQFLMLTLIVGRWLLPKGDLTRDQLSQLLLVYIGTAADIIEFFDSFKDDKILSEPLLVRLTLAIWSWSLLQFTVVLTATKSRKSRVSANGSIGRNATTETCCCSIDVCAIIMNIALQDAPFLAFRLLIIIHYRIVSYMNVFFTCKNTLVILLQMYRLYVVHSETRRGKFQKNKRIKQPENKYKERNRQSKQRHRVKIDADDPDVEIGNIAIISNPADIHRISNKKDVKLRAFIMTNKDDLRDINLSKIWKECERSGDPSTSKENRKSQKSTKKDTVYSTSSPTSASKNKAKNSSSKRKNNTKDDKPSKGEKTGKKSNKSKKEEVYSENSDTASGSESESDEIKQKGKHKNTSNSDNDTSETSE